MGGRQQASSTPQSVGARFAKERDRLGLSRADFAFAAGYSAEQIRKVELGERMPGGELLAALLELQGDVLYVLAGSSKLEEVRKRLQPYDSDTFPTAEEMGNARQAERIRYEAREWRKLRADRLKKVLTEDEADVVDAYRNLSAADRQRALALLQQGLPHEAGHRVQADKGGIAAVGSVKIVNRAKDARIAGRDYHEGSTTKPKK